MVFTHSLRASSWIAMSGITILLLTQIPFPQTGTKSRAASPSSSSADEASRFIVSFELSPENRLAFTWPVIPMRPAPYEAVLLVVEKMPRVRSKDGRLKSLLASRHLSINGGLRKPLRPTRGRDASERLTSEQRFRVRLDRGRLHLSLSIPAGLSLDSQDRTVKVSLYQINQ